MNFQVCRIGLLFPVYSIAYILFPWLSASRIMRHVDQLRITDKQHKYHEGGSNMAILYEQFITRAARCHREIVAMLPERFCSFLGIG